MHPTSRQAELPLTAAPMPDHALREAVGGLDPDALSPREALEALYALKRML